MTATGTAPAAFVRRFFFGVYAWLVFAGGVVVSAVVAILVPGLERRRRWVAAMARAIFRATAVPVSVAGMDKIPAQDCVVVANHASYLDGVLLQGFLPPRFSYVIKGEMGRMPVAGFLLRRIGSRFVERFDASGSARDARQLLRAATAGESLAVFPEGTFIRKAGLGRFRAGAFAAAIRAGVPVVPVVITGTRHIFPAEAWLPRRGAIGIRVLDAIEPDDPVFAGSHELARAAHARILEELDEPDLAVADEV